MRIPKFRRKIMAPVNDGYGKRFTFSTDGESSFQNFSAAEITSILAFMRGEDAMTTRFSGSGQ